MSEISYKNVTLQHGFLKDHETLNREVTIPAVYDRFFETNRIYAVTKKWPENVDRTVHKFWDSDVAKWMESAAYELAKKPDEELMRKVEELIDGIEQNQLPDGYFNSCYDAETRFQSRDNHELYCAGHYMEAAVAYFEATGRDRFLKAMCRYADFIDDYFRVRQAAAFLTPGHEEIELALIKLYRATGNRKYLELSGWFLKTRGANDLDCPVLSRLSANYQQDNVPVYGIREATGHAVRACYLYTAMADYALEAGDSAMLDAAKAVFDDIVRRKMYVTGGIGSSYTGEAFTIPYDLPNETAYAETCAAIALFFFAHRLLLATHEAKYADVMETCLYNGIASGLSRSGDEFFYINPLRLDRKSDERYTMLVSDFPKRPLRHRVKVFRCSCCPPNLARLFSSAGGYVFSEDGDTFYVDLIAASVFEDGNRRVQIDLHERLDGELTIRAKNVSRIALRIPEWHRTAGGYMVSSEPYKAKNGYAVFEASGRDASAESPGFEWEIRIRLEGLRPVAVSADPRVTENVGKIAFRYGPTVYCLEECDNPDVLSLLADGKRLNEAKAEWNDEEKRTELLVPGFRPVFRTEEALYQNTSDALALSPVTLRLIPYRDFANREDADMTVWIPIRS